MVSKKITRLYIFFVIASYHYYTRICERNSGGLDCYSGEIDIIRASYGRHRRGICISRGKDGNTGCHAFNSLSVVRHRCQGQRHCRLYAQNTEFGYDPCVDIEKYLEVGIIARFLEAQYGLHLIFKATLKPEGSKMSFSRLACLYLS